MAIDPGTTGHCPHCRVNVRFELVDVQSDTGSFGRTSPVRFLSLAGHRLDVACASCPACGRLIVTAKHSVDPSRAATALDNQLWPDTANRPVPPEVEVGSPKLAADFREAVAVFPKSKKASAALARRCLQLVLVEQGGAKTRDLATQIDEVLTTLPPSLAENVDAIRQVGNFAAHPLKSTSTGEIADVEDGEAEWLLDVLEELFGYYYVAPAKAAEKRAALNQKLSGLGKPPLKSSGSSGNA